MKSRRGDSAPLQLDLQSRDKCHKLHQPRWDHPTNYDASSPEKLRFYRGNPGVPASDKAWSKLLSLLRQPWPIHSEN